MGNETSERTIAFINAHRRGLIGLGVVGLTLLILASTISGIWSQGVRYETQLSAQYLDNQNYLSNYISSFYEEVGIAQAQTAAVNTVLTDAVKGRYEKTSAGGGGYTVNSPFFNAIAEAYPDINTLMANWGKIQDYIISGREGYRNQQSKLLDLLRTYDTWRNGGFFSRFVISIAGFPSTNLKARIGSEYTSGPQALDKMYQIVLTQDALNAYQDGTLDPLTVPVAPVPSN